MKCFIALVNVSAVEPAMAVAAIVGQRTKARLALAGESADGVRATCVLVTRVSASATFVDVRAKEAVAIVTRCCALAIVTKESCDILAKMVEPRRADSIDAHRKRMAKMRCV